jgi:uncharacterized protein YuzE
MIYIYIRPNCKVHHSKELVTGVLVVDEDVDGFVVGIEILEWQKVSIEHAKPAAGEKEN